MSNHERGGPGLMSQRPGPDEALDRAWRDASDEQPSTQLDDTIVAAARRSVPYSRVEQAAPTTRAAPAPRVPVPSRVTRWQPLAVAASVAGLAFILVQTLPREPDFIAPTREAQKSLPNPDSPPTHSLEQPQPNAIVPAPAARELDHQQQRAEARDLASVQRAVPVPPHEPSASTPVAEAAPTSNDVATAPSSEVAAAAASSIDAAAATDMAAVAAPARNGASSSMSKRLDATDWAASVEAHYVAGDLAGAADKLRAFRALDPRADQYLPDALRPWARSVE